MKKRLLSTLLALLLLCSMAPAAAPARVGGAPDHRGDCDKAPPPKGRPDQGGLFHTPPRDRGHPAPVRGEDGCLQYDYHISCEERDTVVLIEGWRDAAALSAHQKQPHMEEIFKLKDQYVAHTAVARYE